VSRDLAAGGALAAAGAFMAWEARSFPRLGGMAYGPDLFPTIAAAGLVVTGLAIALRGLRAAPVGAMGEDRLAVPRALALAGVAAGFALGLPLLGFHIVAALALLAAARLFGAGWGGAAALALIAPWPLHHLFHAALRVPLPWGVLTPVAW
jgi:putative tricarboxylic transport membrane protein